MSVAHFCLQAKRRQEAQVVRSLFDALSRVNFLPLHHCLTASSMATPAHRHNEGAVRSGEAVDRKGGRQPSWRPSDGCA